MKPKVYGPFDPPPQVALDCSGDPGRTKQSFRDEADINRIMERYRETGVLVDPARLSRRQAFFGNFSGSLDFLELQLQLEAGREAFASLPARVRDRFRNDPAELLAFLEDEANRKEAEELGLIARPKDGVSEKAGVSQAKPDGQAPAVVPPGTAAAGGSDEKAG